MTPHTTAQVLETFELPGDAVFPESIGVDPRSGEAYVGSLADGTLYRLRRDRAEVWSGAGADGRTSVAGVKIDAAGRLWAAGGYEGALHVYDLADRSLLARFDVGDRPSCVNDIAFGPDGTAYVTDSLIPRLFRARGDPLSLEPWVDLDVPWPDGLNFNGIVLTEDGAHLVVCQTNLGRFWQIAVRDGAVREVALDGGPLEHCDGLARSGSTLYVAVNARNAIAAVDLAPDGSAGAVRSTLRGDALAFPTAVAALEDRLLVVNAQLDQMGRKPELPFTVVAVARI